ncbi:hypothetical protein AURDEDRAFT_171481 [Auricularia subglabra TFB-10046 SS5]|nr:hypothetical protein AURDEDRAFT_171481 [Auricularia subglabra TFB-10046 SS5]
MPETQRLFEWFASWYADMARQTNIEPPPRVAHWPLGAASASIFQPLISQRDPDLTGRLVDALQ